MAEDGGGGGGGGVVKRMWSDYFDEEIVSEILARLPVRSILRFRCVCKSWRALIASSHFVKKQLSCAESGNNNSRLLFLQDRPYSIDYEALKDLKEVANGGWFANRRLRFPVTLTTYRLMNQIVRVLGSCNGLVCVEFQGVGIVLWNPCTGDSKVLPAPPTDPHREDFYGFGYDSTIDDYKVIRGSRSSEESLMHVLTLKMGSWRTVRDLDNVECEGKGCLFNGALHWLVPTWGRPRIMSFSLSEEMFEEMFSVMNLGCSYFDSLFVYKDRLCICRIVPGFPASLWLWSMEETSWTPVIELSFKKGIGEELRPLCFLQNGEVLMHRIVNPDDPYALDDPEEDPYDELIRLYYEQVMEEQLMEYPGVDEDLYDEFNGLYHEQAMEEQLMGSPDVDEDPYVEIDWWNNEQLMLEEPCMFYGLDVDEDPDVEVDRFYDMYHQQCMWEAESLLILKDQKTSKAVFEVDVGFGAAIYRETLVSPINLVNQGEI